jgi:hypothetical protein
MRHQLITASVRRVSTPDMTPALPARLPYTLRNHGSRSCQRPNCSLPGVITLNWDGIVLSFCAGHADGKAADPNAEVVWLSPSYGVCPRCGRVLPLRLVAGDHYAATGDACPEMAV